MAREASMLGELAMRSKAHWGYSREFMEACRAELTYPASQIEDCDRTFAVAERAGQPIGFYALGEAAGASVELEALFVEPDHIGSGVGRALVRHAVATAARRGARTLVIQGDPNAAAFYEAVGGVRIGERESASLAGRMLPLYAIRVESGDAGTAAPDLAPK